MFFGVALPPGSTPVVDLPPQGKLPPIPRDVLQARIARERNELKKNSIFKKMGKLLVSSVKHM